MFVICVRVTDAELFDSVCVPGIRRVAEADTVVAEAEADLPVGAAYNEVLEHFEHQPDVEGVVFLDEAAELLEAGFLAEVRSGLADRAVLLGAAGGRDPDDVRWWSGELVGATHEPGGPLGGAPAGPVDLLDGRLLVVPGPLLHLRFEPDEDSVATTAMFCRGAAAAGAGSVVVDFGVRHHRVFDTTPFFELAGARRGGSRATVDAPPSDPSEPPTSTTTEDDREPAPEPSDRTRRDQPMTSWSPQHEDVVVARCIGRVGRYVDLGGGEPDTSPTGGLHELGWPGIVVEADLDRAARFAARRGAESVVAALLPGQTGTATTPVVEPATLFGHLGGHIDLLRVDVGGAERAVLETIDWDSIRPTIVLVPGAQPVDGAAVGYPRPVRRVDGAVADLLAGHGYVAGLFDGRSTFFVPADDLDLVARIGVPANCYDGFVSAGDAGAGIVSRSTSRTT